jgi:transcriptional regulator with XRE-family HTH domain
MLESNGERRAELSDFLRTRRARIVPSEVGLADGVRRRTPGLRREEVALLANIGTTWYTRLEQGLPINVSGEVLDSIARALRLSSEERQHLYLLAGQPLALAPTADLEERVSDLVLRVLTVLDPAPAYVRGRRWDALAWNRAADALFDFSAARGPARNVVWRLFCDPLYRARFGDMSCTTRRSVAQFRAIAAKYPQDTSFVELIDELRARSSEFRQLWAEHDVLGPSEGLKRLVHPTLGELTLDHTTFALPGDGDMRMVVYTAAPGSETESKLASLRDLSLVG